MLLYVALMQSPSTFPAEKLPHWENLISRVYINRPSIHLSCSSLIVCRPPISQRKPFFPAHGNQCTRCTIKTWFLLKKIRFNEQWAGQQQMVRLSGSTKMECMFECLSDQMPVFISKEWRYAPDNIKQGGLTNMAFTFRQMLFHMLHQPRCCIMSKENFRKNKVNDHRFSQFPC